MSQSATNGIGAADGVVAAFFAQDLLANLAQVGFFRRAGFGAAVAFRVAFYLVWHVGYGRAGA